MAASVTVPSLRASGIFFGIELYAEITHASALGRRFFGNMAAEHVHYFPRAHWARAEAGLVGIKERRNRESRAGGRLAGHFHVEAGIDEVDRMNSTPVGCDEALEAELISQDGGQRVLVAACEGAVEAIVRTHDGRDIRAADSGVKWRYINFVKRLVVDVGVLVGQNRIRHSA